MKTIRNYIFAALAAMSFTMCTEDTPELSDVVIFITPEATTPVTVSSGDKTEYTVEVSTSHDYVGRFAISSFDSQYGRITYLDSICNQKSFTHSFIYTAPEIDRDSIDITLTFYAADNIGNNLEVTRSLHVKNKFISIAEQTGIILYNPATGMPDALSLQDVSQPFVLADSPNPESADIYIDCDPEFTSISWKSNTMAKFIRNNTFNYVAATADNINSVYRSSVREDRINDVSINDIIIVGHSDTAEGVFQVKNILRGNGNVACMQLSFKGIKH